MKKQLGQLLAASLMMGAMGIESAGSFGVSKRGSLYSSRSAPLTKLQKKRRLKEKLARKARKINWR